MSSNSIWYGVRCLKTKTFFNSVNNHKMFQSGFEKFYWNTFVVWLYGWHVTRSNNLKSKMEKSWRRPWRTPRKEKETEDRKKKKTLKTPRKGKETEVKNWNWKLTQIDSQLRCPYINTCLFPFRFFLNFISFIFC